MTNPNPPYEPPIVPGRPAEPVSLGTVMPTAPTRRPGWVIPVIAGLAVLVVAVGGGVAYLLTRPVATPQAAPIVTEAPEPTAPAMLSFDQVCIQGVPLVNAARTIIDQISEDPTASKVDRGVLVDTVAGLRRVKPLMPTTALRDDMTEILLPVEVLHNIMINGGENQEIEVLEFQINSVSFLAACDALPDTPEETTPPADKTLITEGTWTIGTDFPAGKYRTTEAVGDRCYWAIYKSGTNGDDIIANDFPGGGRPTVTLKRGQDFKTSDCGDWKKI